MFGPSGVLPRVLPFTQFYPGFTQLPRVKLGKTVQRFTHQPWCPVNVEKSDLDLEPIHLHIRSELSSVCHVSWCFGDINAMKQLEYTASTDLDVGKRGRVLGIHRSGCWFGVKTEMNWFKRIRAFPLLSLCMTPFSFSRATPMLSWCLLLTYLQNGFVLLDSRPSRIILFMQAVQTRWPCTRNQNYGHGGNNYSWH